MVNKAGYSKLPTKEEEPDDDEEDPLELDEMEVKLADMPDHDGLIDTSDSEEEEEIPPDETEEEKAARFKRRREGRALREKLKNRAGEELRQPTQKYQKTELIQKSCKNPKSALKVP